MARTTRDSSVMTAVALAIATVVACAEPEVEPARAIDPAVASPARLELGMTVRVKQWSDDGRYVVFESKPRNNETWDRQQVEIVVDAATFATFELDHVSQLMFAPDHAHLVAVVRHQLVIYDLATGSAVGSPSPISNKVRIAGDGRLAWTERDGARLRVHLRDLGTGAEVVLNGLPQIYSPSPLPESDPVQIQADRRGRVVANTAAAIRLWEHDAPEPTAFADGVFEMLPQLFDDALTFVKQSFDHTAFQIIDLAAPADRRIAILFEHSRACGSGDIQRYSTVERCSQNRYLVRTAERMCVWDSDRAKLVTSIADSRDDYSCHGDVVRIGDAPAGPYTYYSATTGKRLRHHVATIDETARPIVPAGGTAVRSDKLPAGAIDTQLSPDGHRIAGVIDNRGALWSKDGTLLWQTPIPSEIATIAFGGDELAVVGRTGETWHIRLADHRLTTGKLAGCDIAQDRTIAVTPDGRVVAVCSQDDKRRLVLEGAAEPLAEGRDVGQLATAGSNASTATAGWFDGVAIHVWAPPATVEQWSHEVAANAFAVSVDRKRYATVTPIGERPRVPFLTVREPNGRAHMVATLTTVPDAMVFSADAAYLATATADRSGYVIRIYDTSLGTVVDTTIALTDAMAWDPSGKPRLALRRAASTGLAIRDITQQRDTEIRVIAAPLDGQIGSIVWGPDDSIAAVAGQTILLWRGSLLSSTIVLAGKGGVELHPDTTATLIGDPKAARAMFICRSGPIGTPQTWCDDKLVDR